MVNSLRKRLLLCGTDLELELTKKLADVPYILSSSSLQSIDKPSTSTDQYIILANGVKMPMLGLGTTHSGGYYHDSVLHALRHSGYRMIDTARRYGVETELGIAIRESNYVQHMECVFSRTKETETKLSMTTVAFPVKNSSYPRNYGPLTTAMEFHKHSRVNARNYKWTILMLIYSISDVPEWLGKAKSVREETWRQMELLYNVGKCRSIGVSNFDVVDLEEMDDYASILPHVNQSEYHPLYNPTDLRSYCREKNILFTGYCPLGKGRALLLKSIQRIARRLNRTPAQICLRWSIENGIPVIPKSKDIERIDENAQIFDFSLSPEDHEEISKLHCSSNKLLSKDDLSKKWNLPDGYKLNGRVFGVPYDSESSIIPREAKRC